ncbi:MAG: hypothetical protein NZ553_05280 [Caldilinea sp.]|jgi:hypothetical protein|uniref:hypothetical protein n=1 Tax=Caldilinea sp. TaxID=2293560 RepID=UPI0021DE2479|nr:hypothetical protein [Caldilinea sp.]MCS6826012.1 hypothetical protein [Caldilinea sp.]MDW8439870.1 hypothetical protein [Caldilineaceae bacterium]GIV71185.1 MAG: hypothetical protein KatS3mg048_4047 [Caldilinea sp.]
MSHRMRSLLIGAVAGALLGAAFAWVASDADADGEVDAVTALKRLGPMDYFALGIAILNLARQFGGMLHKS